MARASNGEKPNETRVVRMTLGGIIRVAWCGFMVPGVAAQRPASPERGAEQSPRSSQVQPQLELKRFSLLSGTSIDVSPGWIEREQMPLPPSPRLASFAPQVTFLEFMALENPKMHSALRIATTTNPFTGGDEVALDVQMHGAAGSGNGLAVYVFEAQGRMQLDLATVNHFNLPDEMQGAQVDFFWAVGAPSPFPFLQDPQRKNVPLIQVAYAGIGLGPDKRDIFMRLLRQVHLL